MVKGSNKTTVPVLVKTDLTIYTVTFNCSKGIPVALVDVDGYRQYYVHVYTYF